VPREHRVMICQQGFHKTMSYIKILCFVPQLALVLLRKFWWSPCISEPPSDMQAREKRPDETR
jgi:hypothetical protein